MHKSFLSLLLLFLFVSDRRVDRDWRWLVSRLWRFFNSSLPPWTDHFNHSLVHVGSDLSVGDVLSLVKTIATSVWQRGAIGSGVSVWQDIGIGAGESVNFLINVLVADVLSSLGKPSSLLSVGSVRLVLVLGAVEGIDIVISKGVRVGLHSWLGDVFSASLDPASLRAIWSPGAMVLGGVKCVNIVVSESMGVWFHTRFSNVVMCSLRE